MDALTMDDVLNHDKDFYSRHWKSFGAKESLIKFKHNPKEYTAGDYDWYITVALEKADKVTVNRNLLTSDLLLRYRWAIREGFNHQLDPSLKNRFDYPRNRNTIEGIQNYIKLIERKSDEEMADLE
jgi:hypothetical protein